MYWRPPSEMFLGQTDIQIAEMSVHFALEWAAWR